MTINFAKNIIALRKKAGITQEQLSSALNVSAQAVSKWETDSCMPDTLMLPLIAEYFHVSIDYLFYGNEAACDDIFASVTHKISVCDQMSKESYEEALSIFAAAHHGISHGNLKGKFLTDDKSSHISNENGLSLLSGKGYGAIVTRRFFENVDSASADFAFPFFSALADRTNYLVVFAIISMSDISFGELKEKLGLEESALRLSLDALITKNIILEKKSKHKSLGTVYEINSMYHTCLCILIATMEMQRISLDGISCCMGYGDYPIHLNQ